MYINPYLHKRLADQQIREALCVAKLDCLLRGQFKEAKRQDLKFPVAVILLPVMILIHPFQAGFKLLKSHWA